MFKINNIYPFIMIVCAVIFMDCFYLIKNTIYSEDKIRRFLKPKEHDGRDHAEKGESKITL